MANPHPTVRNPWRESELQIIRDHYPTKGAKAVAVMIGRAAHSVRRQASIMAVRCSVRGALLSVTKRAANVSSNIRYFETWTPNMAWLLGYIWADGCIACDSYGPKALQFSCQERDAELIYAIRDELKATTKISTVAAKRIPGTDRTMGQRSVRLKITSRTLVECLVNTHGILPNKSNLDSPFPTNIPDELMGHFARGNLDGDGTVSYSKQQGMSSAEVSFLGNKTWLEGLRDAVCRLTPAKFRPVTSVRGRALHRIRWKTKENLTPLFAWMYPRGDYIYLARKQQSFEAIVEYQRVRVISQAVRNWKPAEDEVIRNRFPQEGARPVANALNRTPNAVQERAWFLGIWRTAEALRAERLATRV